MPEESGHGSTPQDTPPNIEWIFAYGSLIWRPGFNYSHATLGSLPGWRREFSQASPDHRGTPQRPGRVVTLREDKHAHCEGVAYQISTAEIAPIVAYLDERESGGYVRQYVEITLTSMQKVRALTYIALPGNPHACEPTPVDQLVGLIAERSGPSGSNRDYVVNLAKALNRYDIFDPAVEKLVERLL